MIETAAPLLPIVLLWPLLLACIAAVPRVRRHAIRLLPFAPLPALWLGLTAGRETTAIPGLLLGMELGTEPVGALLLVLTATLWLASAIFAQGYLANTRKPAVFAAFWCLTLAGNLGVFLAADVVTFYVAFATVSLAAYVLIVHEATDAALRAGRVYIAMVVLGEVCLLAAFVIGINAADSAGIVAIRAALPAAPLGGLAEILLVAGFGIKAGLMPLHVWLPLAHPAAPTPASAVLSGTIVKAGIIGMILFLPAGLGLAEGLVVLGLAGAFAGALLGLTQTNPKTILAFSTVSQMSLVTGLIGAALADSGEFAQPAFYALHHGLAKGALFLSVGLVAACGGRWRSAALAAIALVALSIAGAPLTGGSVAKLAAKSGLAGAAETAFTISAVTTTLVLAWFVARLAKTEPDASANRPNLLLALPTFGLGLAALVAPWLLGPDWSGLPLDYPLHLSSLWSSLWPVAAGLVAAVLWCLRRSSAPPPGERNVIAMVSDGLARLGRPRFAATFGVAHEAPARLAAGVHILLEATARFADALDCRLRRGRYAGLLLAVFCFTIALAGLLWR